LAQIDGDEVQDSEDDIDAEAGAEADADVGAEVRAEVGLEAEAEAEVVIAETATAVPATDQGDHAGGDGN
jgi:hypothetical protein